VDELAAKVLEESGSYYRCCNNPLCTEDIIRVSFVFKKKVAIFVLYEIHATWCNAFSAATGKKSRNAQDSNLLPLGKTKGKKQAKISYAIGMQLGSATSL
jgi:hypothetical protein